MMAIIFTVPIDFYPSTFMDEDMKEAIAQILGIEDSDQIDIDYDEVDG